MEECERYEAAPCTEKESIGVRPVGLQVPWSMRVDGQIFRDALKRHLPLGGRARGIPYTYRPRPANVTASSEPSPRRYNSCPCRRSTQRPADATEDQRLAAPDGRARRPLFVHAPKAHRRLSCSALQCAQSHAPHYQAGARARVQLRRGGARSAYGTAGKLPDCRGRNAGGWNMYCNRCCFHRPHCETNPAHRPRSASSA